MVKLTIDQRTAEFETGTTVWQAARSMGIHIPTMCYLEETGHITSCMVCLVKNVKNGQLFASCSTPVTDGQIVVTNDAEVIESRKTALSLLLSEHVGDCEAPCQLVCPAHMNIPLMNRLIAKNDFGKSLEVVKRDIALPAILGRICPAPCEAGCRRKQVDEAVSICHLKRFVADEDLKSDNPYRPVPSKKSGRKIAILGAGPAGLSAAWYLQLKGHQSVIFEKSDQPGGSLTQIDKDILPDETINLEIREILASGVDLRLSETIGSGRFEELLLEYDAVVVATGTVSADSQDFGLHRSNTGILAGKSSYQTSAHKVFAIGNALRTSKMAVRSVGQGKEVATVIDHFLATGEVIGYPARFNSKFGLLTADEFLEYQKDSESAPRQISGKEGFEKSEAIREAKRCMHCDCRKPESCVLRELSENYMADQKRFSTGARKKAEKIIHREGIVYEPAKCIKCGICVKLTSIYREEYGLTFIGRGFEVVVGVPFNEMIQQGLKSTAIIVANACPTGALSLFESEEQLDL
jgi:NADPH-dependent glutamate synthase beta subunit-like oxidoreductase